MNVQYGGTARVIFTGQYNPLPTLRRNTSGRFHSYGGTPGARSLLTIRNGSFNGHSIECGGMGHPYRAIEPIPYVIAERQVIVHYSDLHLKVVT